MFKIFFGEGLVPHYLLASLESNTAYAVWFGVCALVSAVCAYLLGSLNFAIIISAKQYRQDIRDFGSKNAGMTNMMRTYGKTAAALTLIGDALKAVIACLIGYALLGQLGCYIAGLFSVIGHIFPLYYRFKGGKGVVTAGITILMCNPIVFLILITLFLLLVLLTRYISLGSIMCMMLFPIVLNGVECSPFFHTDPPPVSPYILFAALIMLFVVIKHTENIKRLLKGTENKFSFKKSVKKPPVEAEKSEQKKQS